MNVQSLLLLPGLLTATLLLLACTQSPRNVVDGDNQVIPTIETVDKIAEKQASKTNESVSGTASVESVTAEKSMTFTQTSLRADHEMSVSASRERRLNAFEVDSSYIASPSASTVMLSLRAASKPVNRENYAHFDDNPIKRVDEIPVSTFSIDVDTGAYSNVRRMLNAGRLPVHDSVRVEEMLNYFSYNYPQPVNNKTPFRVSTEIGPSPWNPDTHLLHIGIKGYDIDDQPLPASNLVFLIDVSGSMKSANKLGLLKTSLKLLIKKLRAQDHISMIVYAGASGVVLEPVSGKEKFKINSALDKLTARGRTNGAAGIQQAYALAEQAFIKDGINRIILATDGDFNVGTVDFEALKNLVEEKRKTGISLTTLGFGTGNYNDHLMEQLADAGNGNYAYIDTLNEAQKVLINAISSTLFTIAMDVKIQIEFNPDIVAEYRLIGYENRSLKREDFNNDKIDAGDIGAGHTVTALYEIALKNSKGQLMDPLRYGEKRQDINSHGNELAILRLRYKQPKGEKSRLIENIIEESSIGYDLDKTTERFRFSASVASFGQLLRGGQYLQEYDYDDALALAKQSRANDPFGYRGEFLQLLNLAKSLSSNATTSQN